LQDATTSIVLTELGEHVQVDLPPETAKILKPIPTATKVPPSVPAAAPEVPAVTSPRREDLRVGLGDEPGALLLEDDGVARAALAVEDGEKPADVLALGEERRRLPREPERHGREQHPREGEGREPRAVLVLVAAVGGERDDDEAHGHDRRGPEQALRQVLEPRQVGPSPHPRLGPDPRMSRAVLFARYGNLLKYALVACCTGLRWSDAAGME
jgi:hypothetical protein